MADNDAGKGVFNDCAFTFIQSNDLSEDRIKTVRMATASHPDQSKQLIQVRR